MTTRQKKQDYLSPECRKVSISPQTQLLQIGSTPLVTLDAFDLYDDMIDPYFG